jgi:hypothetical protein
VLESWPFVWTLDLWVRSWLEALKSRTSVWPLLLIEIVWTTSVIQSGSKIIVVIGLTGPAEVTDTK